MRFISDDDGRSSAVWPWRNTVVVGSLALVTSLAVGIGAAGGLSVLDSPESDERHTVPPALAAPRPPVIVPEKPGTPSPNPARPQERETSQDGVSGAADVGNAREPESKPVKPPAETPVDETGDEVESVVWREVGEVTGWVSLDHESVGSPEWKGPECPVESLDLRLEWETETSSEVSESSMYER